MNDFVKSDLYRYRGIINLKTFWWCFIRIPGFRFMFFVRTIRIKKKYSLIRLFSLLAYYHYAYKYGFQIPYQTNIGKGFYIGHFGTIVINRNSIIGNNCNIAHNVTIGQTNRGDKRGAPIIGDCVWMGTGSVIVGAINIGNNVLIAPNSYVNFDVPANSLVIGNPAKIINKADVIAGYINNQY